MAKYGGTVYIVCNFNHNVRYIGVTSNLFARITEHREKAHPDSFTARYNCSKLVYFENFGRIEEAIYREKQLKKWKRAWKMDLITSFNPEWCDLFETLDN